MTKGVVVGRVCKEQIWVKTTRDVTVRLRVTPELGAELDLGQRVLIEFDAKQRPCGIRPLPAGDSQEV